MRDWRILITGSRDWTDRDAIRGALLRAIRAADVRAANVTVIHGGARGADTIADVIARHFGCLVKRYPADWKRYGRSAGHRRNAEMVSLGADICLGFPLGESRGTRGCMTLAHNAGIPVITHEHGRAEPWTP
jgi:hypothetical protein